MQYDLVMAIDTEKIEKAIASRPACWRKGQAAFNALDEQSHEAAEHISGTPADPYYYDSRVVSFFAELDRMNKTGDW